MDDSDWIRYLSTVEFSINDSVSQSTGFTPFYLAFGQHPESLELSSTLDSVKPDWNLLITQARTSIEKAQAHQAAVYNKNRKESPILVNDLVLVERVGINWQPDSQRSKKLLSPWLGPFRVLALEGLNATLELPSSALIHNVFCVSKLKKYHI